MAHSRTYHPLVASVIGLARLSGEFELIFKELCRGPNAPETHEFSNATQDTSSVCYVTYRRLILNLLQLCSAQRITLF